MVYYFFTVTSLLNIVVQNGQEVSYEKAAGIHADDGCLRGGGEKGDAHRGGSCADGTCDGNPLAGVGTDGKRDEDAWGASRTSIFRCFSLCVLRRRRADCK